MIERKLIGIEGNINILEADILDFRRRILMEKLAFIDLRNERVELMKNAGVESKSDDDDDDDDDDTATVPDISHMEKKMNILMQQILLMVIQKRRIRIMELQKWLWMLKQVIMGKEILLYHLVDIDHQ